MLYMIFSCFKYYVNISHHVSELQRGLHTPESMPHSQHAAHKIPNSNCQIIILVTVTKHGGSVMLWIFVTRYSRVFGAVLIAILGV